jgi:hypothetical protein
LRVSYHVSHFSREYYSGQAHEVESEGRFLSSSRYRQSSHNEKNLVVFASFSPNTKLAIEGQI